MADINDYIDQYAEEPKEPPKKRDPLSFMSAGFQSGVEAFLRGAPFATETSSEWKEGWSFAMRTTFYHNTFKYVFGTKS